MSILLVEKTEEGLQCAVINRGKLYACQSVIASTSLQEGQIFIGIVDRAVKGLHAVFIRLPGGASGFLPIAPASMLPPSGSPLTVQVKHPPIGKKQAMLTEEISLPAATLVFLPFGKGIRLSSRITDPEERDRLKQLGASLSVLQGGIILRSAALECPAEELQRELAILMDHWTSIASHSRTAPALLWGGSDVLTRFLQEEKGRLEYVLTNEPDALPDGLSCSIRTSETPFLLHNVRHKLERSLRRTVQMKSGATLVIDPCEAMTVIDVNSARTASGKSAAETAEKINVEAAWEIARLLRLRDIGGMILIDFIDMPTAEARDRLTAAMREALLEDPNKTVIHDITVLGIMELTRRRTQVQRASLPDQPCPHCGGTGIILFPDEEDA